ncbi:MAG: diguanylate cyclase [Campylobacterota bacterium]|nr:diguanylate cyclase [Campylobacterota bacterium]
MIFRTQIDIDEIKNIFKDAKNTTEPNKKIIREKLYNKLNDTYSLLKESNIKQLHFHLPNNESFLRFHRPYKFGDDLTKIRETVKYVNENKKPIFGFEEGRIYNGYRFVFPLSYKNEYIGSVEISFSTIAMTTEMIKNFNVVSKFLISKDIVKEKVFKSEKNNYSQSLFEDFLYETKIANTIRHFNKNNEIATASNKTKKILKQNAMSIHSFSLYDEASKSIMTFIKVINPVTNKVSGILTIRSDNHYVASQTTNFYLLLIGATITILFSLVFIYKSINEKKILNELVDEKTNILTKINRELEESEYVLEILNENLEQKVDERTKELKLANENLKLFIDTQDSIVILTDGEELNFANKKFFEFFGFEDLENFNKYHNCICEYFIENDRFFHLGKLKEDENWVSVLETLGHSQRVVSLMRSDFKVHALSVTINKFNENLKIITFTDISQTMLGYIKLEEKTIHDKLTDAYNREYFEQNYKRHINQFKNDGYKFGLALLDIDHFKLVNDTYGHDMGDEILIKFVKIIEEYSRKDDILIRWGGEEFIMILKVNSKKDLEKALEHIRKVLEIQKYGIVGQKTCSIGGTIFKDDEDIKETIKRADTAVYEAKETGRNKVVISI